jgi:uncharacterized membrane protein YadS
LGETTEWVKIPRGLAAIGVGKSTYARCGLMTIVAMAALGLGVSIRAVASAGTRVTGTVTISLLLLCAISLGLIRALGIV